MTQQEQFIQIKTIHSFTFFFLLILSLFTKQVHSQTPLSCSLYLASLHKMSITNKTQFAKAIAPYVLLSGKMVDDMGLPLTCLKTPAFNYWTVATQITQTIGTRNETNTVYLGICFSNKCNAQILNKQGVILINAFLANSTNNNFVVDSFTFYNVNMEASNTTASILVSLLFTAFILFRMSQSFKKWFRQCGSQSDEQSLAIQMSEQTEQKDPGRIVQQTSIINKLSLQRAIKDLFIPEQSNKIMGFSLFKLFSIPFITFGFQFYLNNFGTANFFSMNNQVYSTYYARIALFSYYLPDIFFFISGYLLSRSLTHIQNVSQDKIKENFKYIGKKLLKLYPLYFAIIIIYAAVTPALHAGPLWSIFQNRVNQCSTTWWRALLLIDNWFYQGCFNYSWYVQLQIQFALVIAIVFCILAWKRLPAMIILNVLYGISFILLFALGAPLPSSIQTAVSPQAQVYFQSFYSHWFFHLTGVFIAFAFQKQSVRAFFKTYFIQKVTIFTTGIVVAFGLLVFIISLPGVWYNLLSLQLSFCRLGVMIAFLVFFIKSLVGQQPQKTYIHKLAKVSYGILLAMGLIALCGFWGLDTFPYTDGLNLLASTVTTILLSIPVGGFLYVLFDFTVLSE